MGNLKLWHSNIVTHCESSSIISFENNKQLQAAMALQDNIIQIITNQKEINSQDCLSPPLQTLRPLNQYHMDIIM